MKYSFKNDYSEGCHPRILEALHETNLLQQAGYGLDEYCEEATSLIKTHIANNAATIHYVSGGTQANLMVIAAALRPHESVISCETGHICTNETAAIEATGHKAHPVKSPSGKLSVDGILGVLQTHTNRPHQAKPKMVYISNATELGTFYTKTELQELSDFCKKENLYLFVDGARIGQAIMAEGSDVTFADIAELADVFYIGGTKNGALLGEAIVIVNRELQEDFAFNVKQRGGLLAKGRLLGLQFRELFCDGLYFDLAKNANDKAMEIKSAFKNKGIGFLPETFTNQIFPVLNNEQISILQEDFDFYQWQKIDENRTAIRLITSWATPDYALVMLINKIKML